MSTNQALWQARADALFNTTRTAKEDITGMQKIVNIITDVGSELTVEEVRSAVQLVAPILNGTLDQFLADRIMDEIDFDVPFIDERAAIGRAVSAMLRKLNVLEAPFVAPDIIQENLQSLNDILDNNDGADIFPETRPIIALENVEPILDNRLTTLDALLSCLDAFARKQWAFFHDGFERNSDDAKKGYLSYSKRYPEEFVYRATLDQIAFDLEVMQKAFTQSLRVGNSPEALKAMRLADKYVAFLLDLVSTRRDENDEEIPRLIGKTAAVTYMGKSFQARIVPYAPVALIGVPTTIVHAVDYDTEGLICRDEDGQAYPEENDSPERCYDAQGTENPRPNVRDFLAISHEVGHYIFRHGAIRVGTRNMSISRAVYNLTPLLPAWLDGWVEEIFADVFGAVTAGGAAGETAREIQLDNDPARLLSYDTRYPFGALRPYIYSDVLQRIKHPAGDQLERLWGNEMLVRGISVDTTVAINGEQYSLAQLRTYMRGVISACLLILARQYEDQQIESGGQLVSARRRLHRQSRTMGGSTLLPLPEWEPDELVIEQLPRPVADIPADVEEFTKQLVSLLQGEDAPPLLRLQLIEEDSKWQLMENGEQISDGTVGDTVRVLGGDVRDIYVNTLKSDSRFEHDRLPPEIWEVVFSMNGWTTGGPEDDGNATGL